MKSDVWLSTLLVVAAFTGCTTSKPEMMGNLHRELDMESFYLPDAQVSRVVSLTTNGVAAATILVQTHRAAVKEGGPKETVEKFGEVYAFSPTFFAVHRDEATRIRFWNLQPDDNHAFMLIDPHSQVLMNAWLPPLRETAYVFTFHQEGLFKFVCALHPTPMTGQILVLPPPTPSK
jgi:plastocyanin